MNAAAAYSFEIEESGSCKFSTPYIGVLSSVSFPNIRLKHPLKKVLVRFKPGYSIGVVCGFHFDSHWILESEVSYQKAEVNHFSIPPERFKTVGGHFRMTSFVENFIYDFNWDYPLVPYFGSGIGYAQAKGRYKGFREFDGIDGFGFFCPKNSLESHAYFHKSGVVVQMILGVAYSPKSSWKLGIDYRCFMMDDSIIAHKIGCNLIKEF